MGQTDPSNAEHALDYAWDWFALHASHRMQSFNYFLVASAFLFAAYAALLKEQPWASFTTGLVGAWVSSGSTDLSAGRSNY